MPNRLDDLVPFQEICRKICLNIPDSAIWEWDEERQMAKMILDEKDAELVFYPLFKEFQSHWNYDSTPETAKSVSGFVQETYGLMPGQVFFTSHVLCDLVLGVAWWPWGSDHKVSMRVGLISANEKKIDPAMAQNCLSRWLKIKDSPA